MYLPYALSTTAGSNDAGHLVLASNDAERRGG